MTGASTRRRTRLNLVSLVYLARPRDVRRSLFPLQ